MKKTYTYIISSYLLREVRDWLVFNSHVWDEFNEVLLFLTGVKLTPEIIILTNTVKVKLVRSTAGGADPDPKELPRVYDTVLRYGHDLYCQVHIHPGKGKSSAYASSTDLGTARRWEAGEAFLGIVFSEDGEWFHCFNFEQRSIVNIYGNNIERVSEFLYRFTSGEGNNDESTTASRNDEAADGQAGDAGLVGPEQAQPEPDTSDRSGGSGRSDSEDAGADGSSD
jgi:hypothetical protein